jgi:lipopolysaccharide/colanic/teichoic acid biosynthesis glycosyltransferase
MLVAGPSPCPISVWGLDPIQLHARFWASRGVQVVRLGERSEIVPHAELFLLTDPRTLALFRLAGILDMLSWVAPDLVSIRLRDPRSGEYREQVVTEDDGRFVRFERIYEGSDPRMVRVGLTSDEELAWVWQGSPDPRTGWARLRRMVPRQSRYAAALRARVFDASRADEVARFTRELVRYWRRPDATIARARSLGRGIWADESVRLTPGPGVRGPLWIGAGREIEKDASAVGPAVIWDRPDRRPEDPGVRWLELEPLASATSTQGRRGRFRPYRAVKRMFDLVFAAAALLLALPLYPILAAAIVIEDGFPVFFRHRRETLGGREFWCIKFRSMKNNAEQTKAELARQNLADGPQFYIPNDPRTTRVGAIMRNLQLDELPQFINVLRGEMSIVGPRPSPFDENQYCPPWREARLSVRPGVTGLWQISRTRAEGTDFQEWIKYDIQYVERQSFRLDMWIIWQTVLMLIRKVTRP